MPYKRKRGIIMEKKKHPGKIIGLIAGGVVLLIVIIVIAASFMGGSDDMQGSSLDQETINKVRNFAPDGSNGVTFGQAYANFYSDPDWKSFTSEQENTIVEFSGKCTYNDQTGDAYLQFVITDGGQVMISYAQFKDEGSTEKSDLSDDELYDLFYKPFVTYADEHGTALTDEQINTLYGKDVTDSSSEE